MEEYTENEKVAFLKGVKAGRDAQRESDVKAILSAADIESPLRVVASGFATIVKNNTGDL